MCKKMFEKGKDPLVEVIQNQCKILSNSEETYKCARNPIKFRRDLCARKSFSKGRDPLCKIYLSMSPL